MIYMQSEQVIEVSSKQAIGSPIFHVDIPVLIIPRIHSGLINSSRLRTQFFNWHFLSTKTSQELKG